MSDNLEIIEVEESQFDDKGHQIKKIVKKKKKPLLETLDTSIKIIGIVAIFIPILLIYLEKRNENIAEKRKHLSEIYIDLNKDLNLVDLRADEDYDNLKIDTLLKRLEMDYPYKFLIYSDSFTFKKLLTCVNLKRLEFEYEKLIRRTVMTDATLNFLSDYLNKTEAGKLRDQWLKDSAKILSTIRKNYNEDTNLRSLNIIYSNIEEYNNKLKVSDEDLNRSRFQHDSIGLVICSDLARFTTVSQLSSFIDTKIKSGQINEISTKISWFIQNKWFIRDSIYPKLSEAYSVCKAKFDKEVFKYLSN